MMMMTSTMIIILLKKHRMPEGPSANLCLNCIEIRKAFGISSYCLWFAAGIFNYPIII